MRGALALSAVLLCVAGGAQAQFRGLPDGGGPSTGAQSQKLTLVPADQYLTVTYPWATLPNTSAGNGWFQQQSTAAGVTIAAQPPFLELTAATANKRALLWERGVQPDGLAVPMSATDEVTIAFNVTGCDLISSSTNGFFQFSYGDTNSYLVTKFPQTFDSFGIIVAGTGKAAAASAPTTKLACYTVGYGGGAGDTNYVSVTPTQLTAMKVWIHAQPGGGNVDFWINDILVASLPSLRQVGDPTNFGCAFWINGDATTTVAAALGPVTVQRVWP